MGENFELYEDSWHDASEFINKYPYRLIVKAEWSQEIDHLIEQFDVCRFWLLDYDAKNLEVLRPYINGIREISLSGSITAQDVSIINEMINLEHLATNTKCDQIDLSNFSKLRVLQIFTQTVPEGWLKSAALQELDINELKVSAFEMLPENTPNLVQLSCGNRYTRSLSGVSELKCLEIFRTGEFRMQSLIGLDGSTSIREFWVVYASQLTDVSAVKHLPNLEEVKLIKCNRLSDLSPLKSLKNLKHLVLDLKQVNDIHWVKSLKRLEVLDMSGEGKIEDGNLSAITELSNLKELYLKSRRHYSPPVVELKKRVGMQ